MSEPSLASHSCKPVCECRGCECQTCPKTLQDSDPSSHVCDHGTRPKCGCNDPKPKPQSCQPCCLNEPEPVPDPERTQSLMKVLKYDKTCICKVVCRAVRADVHRYLGMVDRHIHKKPIPPPPDPDTE